MAMKIGICCAGKRGAALARMSALGGLEVLLADGREGSAAQAVAAIEADLLQEVEAGKLREKRARAALRSLRAAAVEELADTALVIEAVEGTPEDRLAMLRRLHGLCAPETVFALTGAELPLGELARETGRPGRVLGLRYHQPVAKNKLLELALPAGCELEAAELAERVGQAQGKIVLRAADAPGLVLERVRTALFAAAVRLLAAGGSVPAVEQAAVEALGLPAGPFELMNAMGLPAAAQACRELSAAYGPFYAADELEARAASGEDWDLSAEGAGTGDACAAALLSGAVFASAATLVEAGVCPLEDCDRAIRLGLRWRAGPFELMNRAGIAEALRRSELACESAGRPGAPALLREQAAEGKPFAFQMVDLSVKNRIAWLRINRPEAMNALNGEVIDQLHARLREAEADPGVDAIAVTGAGSAFVAGADIKFFVDNIKRDQIENSVAFTRRGHELLLHLERCTKPTVAVVDGLSLGGGSELALACRAIVATEGACFGFPETGIGIYPGFGGMIRSARMLGKPLAKYYILTGRMIRAADAQRLGMITCLVRPEEVRAAVEALAKEGVPDKYATLPLAHGAGEALLFPDGGLDTLLRGETPPGADPALAEQTAALLKTKAPLALRAIDELMDAQDGVSVEEAIELELGRLTEIFSSEDALVGLTAKPGAPITFVGR